MKCFAIVHAYDAQINRHVATTQMCMMGKIDLKNFEDVKRSKSSLNTSQF